MVLTTDAINNWQAKTGTMPEPTRAKFLAAMAAGDDEYEEYERLTEAQLRATVKDVDGVGSAGKQAVIDWFLGRKAAEATDTMAHAALTLADEADKKGMVGKAKETYVDSGLARKQRAMPTEIGKSPWCQCLYVMGNDSGKLGKELVTFTGLDGSVDQLNRDSEGNLTVKSEKAYEKAIILSCLPAFLEWQAANKRACYKYDKDPLVFRWRLNELSTDMRQRYRGNPGALLKLRVNEWF